MNYRTKLNYGTKCRAAAPIAVETRDAPFVLVSHHRCGSNFVTDVLRCHPALDVAREPLAQHLPVFVHRDLEPWTSPADLVSDARIALSRPFERSFLRDFRRWLAHPGRGFKETRLAEKLGWFCSEVVPVRTVVLVRDPRAVTASILRRAHLVDYWLPAHHVAYLPPAVDRDRARRDPVFRSAAVWNHRYSRLVARAHRSGSPVIALERVMAEPAPSLRTIERHLGIPAFDYTAVLAEMWSGQGAGTYSTRRDPGDVVDGWRHSLPRAESNTIRAVCGDLMEQLGYDASGW